MSERLPSAEHEHLKELSHAWGERLDAKLNELVSRPEVTRDEFFEALWTDGIIARLMPDNPAEMEARQVLGKTVWTKGKDDPELYVRILYSAEKVRYAMDHGYTTYGSSRNLINPAFQGILHQYASEAGRSFLGKFAVQSNDRDNPFRWMLDQVQHRSRTELKALGANSDQPLIPAGSVGTFHGFKVWVDTYTDSGGLWLRGETPEDHDGIYPWVQQGGVSPTDVDPKDFHLPEAGN